MLTTPKRCSILPDIVLTKSPEKLILTTKSPGKSPGLYKKKPAYLAKKIATEDLFDEINKQGPVLSQINEEKFNEVDEPNETSINGSAADLNQEDRSPESRNVFHKESIVSSKFKEHGKGPMYTDAGAVVKHSIVGSAEMFERFQRMQKKGGPMKESGLFSDKENASFSERSGSKVFKHLSSLQQANDQSQLSHSRLNTQNSTVAKRYMPASEKKKEIKKTIRVSKEDLYMKINEMRTTQEKFYEDEAKRYNSEPLSDQLFHSKEQRCLDKYDKCLVQWDNTLDALNRKIKRNVGKPMMASSDGFREKMEEAEAFTLTQSDHERFGSTYWYMTLRNYGGDSGKGMQRIIHDIPDGFNCPQVHRPPSSMEVVNKPSKLTKTLSPLPSLVSSTMYLDRTRKEYVNEKSTLLKKELKRIKPTDTLMIDDFMVEGRNKLELEVTAFFNKNPSRDVYHVPKEFFEEKFVEEEAEYYGRHYEGREIIKNGIGACIKD